MVRFAGGVIAGALSMAAYGVAVERAVPVGRPVGTPCPHAARAAELEALVRASGDRLVEQDLALLRLRADLDAARRDRSGVRPAAVDAADLIPPTVLPER